MPDPRFIATIAVGEKVYSAWESVMVRRDFKNGISVFQFTPAEGAYGKNYAEFAIKRGDPVSITLGGHKVISGCITTRSVSYDSQSHQVVIAGKSLTMDVKDSSVDIKPGSLDGSTFEQATRKVLEPHGIGLVIKNPPAIASKPFKALMPQFGETGGEFIGRMAAQRGMFLSDDKDGNLVAGQSDPGAAPVAELVEGKNIKRASSLEDDQTAFSKYSTVSQTPGVGDDKPPRWYSTTATSSLSRPNRYLLQISEHPIEQDELEQRNNHEVVNSLWPVMRASITVVGWLKDDGSLWEPTENVAVDSPMLFPDQNGFVHLGIQSCTYAQDSEDGTTTTMELVLPWMLTSNPSNGLDDAPLGGDGDADSRPDAPDYLTT